MTRLDVPSEQELRGPVWLDDGGRWQPLGSQLGSPATAQTGQNASAPADAPATAVDAGGRVEIAIAEQPDGTPAAAGSALSGLALTFYGGRGRRRRVRSVQRRWCQSPCTRR